ncbi:hypothetical protein GGTG_07552 [Gaeumannomyces tritici R3-111a-1]|uniref:Tyrosinase copper-binding domain-containing protein n=1 Tax=Gaeumannomyces tritici (strain R3-111a-1) TaxID=644352 RepID=J3P204_GAET3|nr:hypothetical protein GGTG_07552 [Gaeumannomyces tritici R3-111a-1]EJT73696.1 hypothetical protein GGTG_07552 [Gaeumannomyces tritici R3-111a-1]
MLPITLLSLVAAATASAIPAPRATQCTTPEVRKEWRELSTDEKAEYIRAAKCLRELPKQKYADVAAVTTRMDDLVWTHFKLNLDIHFVANFLPWHRWYVQLHQDLLRNECGYKGTQPYWDWSIDADALNTAHSPVFDPATGFGGDGRRMPAGAAPGFERCVADGPFANTNLTIGMGWPDVNTVGNRRHCFTRELNNASGRDADGNMIVGDMQAAAYNTRVMRTVDGLPTYALMHDMLEGLPHAQVHSIIFGDMGPATSPNEPLFMLHHANVDRAWARWQGRNATRLADYSGFNDRNKVNSAHITDKMPVVELADVQPIVQDYMDIQAGPLCYTYSKMTL